MASALLLDRRPEYGTILRILDTFRTSPEPNDTKKFGIQRGHGIATPLARLSGAMHGAIALFIQSQRRPLPTRKVSSTTD